MFPSGFTSSRVPDSPGLLLFPAVVTGETGAAGVWGGGGGGVGVGGCLLSVLFSKRSGLSRCIDSGSSTILSSRTKRGGVNGGIGEGVVEVKELDLVVGGGEDLPKPNHFISLSTRKVARG